MKGRASNPERVLVGFSANAAKQVSIYTPRPVFGRYGSVNTLRDLINEGPNASLKPDFSGNFKRKDERNVDLAIEEEGVIFGPFSNGCYFDIRDLNDAVNVLNIAFRSHLGTINLTTSILQNREGNILLILKSDKEDFSNPKTRERILKTDLTGTIEFVKSDLHKALSVPYQARTTSKTIQAPALSTISGEDCAALLTRIFHNQKLADTVKQQKAASQDKPVLPPAEIAVTFEKDRESLTISSKSAQLPQTIKRLLNREDPLPPREVVVPRRVVASLASAGSYANVVKAGASAPTIGSQLARL